jgi:ADP-ribose pyrophosphatase YjhB (NUDIX family)
MDYVYHYENGEANFGPPLESEVTGGAHLTFDVILHSGTTVFACRRPDGLHDGPHNALYFPHGLIRFSETVDEAVARLAKDQAGAVVRSTEIYNLPTWVDENNHWHLCLNVFARIGETPSGGPGVSKIVQVNPGDPAAEFAWWTQEQLDRMFKVLGERVSHQ